MLAMMIITIIGAVAVRMYQSLMVGVERTQGDMTNQKLLSTAESKLKNIPFFQLFSVDSSSANFGLSGTFPGKSGTGSGPYPYIKVLADLLVDANTMGYDRYTVNVTYMRRDKSDGNANGNTYDMIPFTDNGMGVDLYDDTILYDDHNGDGDFNDTYESNKIWPYTKQIMSEVPSTNMRRVEVTFYKKGKPAAPVNFLVNNGQFTGEERVSAEHVFQILVATPAPITVAYRAETTTQINARNVSITKPYAGGIPFIRAESSSPMPIRGITEELANVKISVNNPNTLATLATDSFRQFTGTPLAVTTALLEGINYVYCYAEKAGLYSPIAIQKVTLDTVPPDISDFTPANTTNGVGYTPFVGAKLFDQTTATSNVSGIEPSVITMKVNGLVVQHRFRPDGFVQYVVDGSTTSPNYITPLLGPTSSYSVVVEGGDRAGYKVSKSWNFNVTPPSDFSAPTITDCTTSGKRLKLTFTDEESGIKPSSIIVRIDGNIVVDAGNVGQYFDVKTGVLTYPTELTGVYEITAEATHWSSYNLSASIPAGACYATF